jgi:PKD domain
MVSAFALLGILALWLGGTSLAAACSIDGVPSLTMDGKLVTINFGQATKDNFAYWAAFSLGSAPAGRRLGMAEDLPKVRQALSAGAMSTPFSWSFGDGDDARGAAVRHTYAQPGWYKVDVSYYLPAKRQWVIFDSAQVQIVSTAGSSAAAGASRVIWLSGASLAVVAIASGALRYARRVWRCKHIAATTNRERRVTIGGTQTGRKKPR